MNILIDTTHINDEDTFDREIAWPTAKEFGQFLGQFTIDKDIIDTIHERIVQEFKRKGFGPLPSDLDRLLFGEHRFMRVDIDAVTHNVLITNRFSCINGTTFTPYPIATDEDWLANKKENT